jgi:uridine kinase
MPLRVTAEEVVARLARTLHPPLIAIDGLSCSGKSTLADQLQAAYGFECLYLDEFIRPKEEWLWQSKPAFPFQYIRYDEFIAAIGTLATTGQCTCLPFDWESQAISKEPRTVSQARPVIIEGVSALNPTLTELYGLRIFVDSDRSTTLEAAIGRDRGMWADEWRDLFLPSVDLYMQTDPERRADLIVPGRGAPSAKSR